MLRAWTALLGLAAFLLLTGPGTASRLSGLRGTVVVDPSRPVCIQGEPCSAPAPGVLVGFGRDDRVVGRTTTKADGTYRIVLPPGRYAVSLLPGRGPRGITPRTVRVVAGRMVRIDFTIDTGIQ